MRNVQCRISEILTHSVLRRRPFTASLVFSSHMCQAAKSSAKSNQASVCLPVINSHLQMKRTRALLFMVLEEVLISGVVLIQ